MKIMPTRYEMLLQAIDAFHKTHIHFLGKKGENYYPLWGGDDLGAIYFITKIAYFFNLSNDSAILVFYIAALFIAFFTSVIFFLKINKITLLKKCYIISTISLLVLVSYNIGDVYIFYSVAPLLCVPLFLMQKENLSYMNILFYIICGLLIGYSNYIRAHSGTAVFIFIIFYLLLKKISFTKSLIIFILLFFGVFITKLHFNFTLKERDNFLKTRGIEVTIEKNKHVLWHNVFIGLGFIYNKYNITPTDTCALEWVKKIDSSIAYFSQEYESTLKKEFFRILRESIGFVLNSYFAKLGIIGAYLLLSLNFSLIFIFRNSCKFFRNYRFYFPFLLAIGWGILPGLLFLPFNSYILGGITFCVLLSNFIIINEG